MKNSIIIINYNTAHMTARCIQGVLNALMTANHSFEIIVVDNCSKIDDYQTLKSLVASMPHTTLVRNSFNSGFGLGNMIGVNLARGEYLTFLNSDTLIEEDCVTPLLDYLAQNPNAGVITPQHTNTDGQKVHSFDYYINFRQNFVGLWLYLLTSSKHTPNPKKEYNVPIAVDFVYGCFMMFRRSAFAQVGGFDPNIFLYYEEMDVCWRLKKAGYQSIFYPQAKFKHVGGGSSSQVNTHFERVVSTLYMLRKNEGYLRYAAFKFLLVIQSGFKGIFRPKKYLTLFFKLLFLGPPQASSMRVSQTVDEFWVK